MIAQDLIAFTRKRFPTVDEKVEVVPIEKGGSDRKYYRISTTQTLPLILVKYGNEREENCHYVEIARFLDGIGVHVPRIYFHDAAEQLIWMQDLGEVDLWSYRHEAWDVRQPLYEGTIAEVYRLHRDGVGKMDVVQLQTEFDERLYLWEQHYFLEHCLGRYLEVDQQEIAPLWTDGGLQSVAASLAALPRVLIHRDFQSQNVMVMADQPYLIDFQGLRLGLPHYDLASLLYDPYVTLTAAERSELLSYYMGLAEADGSPQEEQEFTRVFYLCAMQRLMQALGAYGYLGLVQNREQFLQYIPVALQSLREICGSQPETAAVCRILKRFE